MTTVNKNVVIDQLNVLESAGVCKWQHASNGRFGITPDGGVTMLLTKREAWLWVSGAMTVIGIIGYAESKGKLKVT